MDSESLLKGDYKRIILSLAVAYPGMTYLNPKIFELLDKKTYSADIFILFCIIYLILPLSLFLVFSFTKRKEFVGLIKKGNKKITTFSLIGVIIIIILCINISYFCSIEMSDPFNKLEKYRIEVENYKDYQAEILPEISKYCLEKELYILSDSSRKVNTKRFNISISLDSSYLNSNLIKIRNEVKVNENRTYYTYADINAIRDLTRKIFEYYRIVFLNKTAGKVEDNFKQKFEKIKIVYLYEIIVVIIILLFIKYIYKKQHRQCNIEGTYVNTLLGLYILIGIQIIGSQSFSYIDIDKKGFQYKVASWYAPSFISNTVNEYANVKTDRSIKSYYSTADNEELNSKLNKIIDLLQVDTSMIRIDSVRFNSQIRRNIYTQLNILNSKTDLIRSAVNTHGDSLRELQVELNEMKNNIQNIESIVEKTYSSTSEFSKYIRSGGSQ